VTDTSDATLGASKAQVMILHDGGSLAAFKNKGNLTHYVETLYNPRDYFRRAHIVVFDKADLSVALQNPTLRVHYLRHLSFGSRTGRLGRYIGRGLSLPFMLYQTTRIARREGVTVIRARNAYLAGFLAVLTGKIAGVPTVVSLGGDNRIAQELLGRYYTYSRFLSFRLEEFALRHADRVFCTNEFTRRYAIRLGVPPERTRVVPHRVDLHLIGTEDEDRARRELGLGERPMVLFVGRFERDKQVDVVIEAIPAILREHPRTVFVFVGDGSLRGRLEARCRELRISESVEFAGYQSRDRIAKYLAAASVVWIPMSGFVIYEAAAARKPIVAFDVEWHSEFVEHNLTGMLVPNRDVAQLAKAVATLLDNPDHARVLAAAASEKFHTENDQAMLVDQEIREYVEVMAGASVLERTPTC
jgi:glycosyltransferase involved in cell wall biosynthesis